MVESKSTCPKWHFGQVGHGGKKPYGGFFWPTFSTKKVEIFCNDSVKHKAKIIKGMHNIDASGQLTHNQATSLSVSR